MENFHVCFKDDIQFFYDVMLNGKQITNEEELKEFEASYFAMCLLIPENTIRSIVEKAGIGFSLKQTSISALSKLFMVDERLMKIRLTTLYPSDDYIIKNAISIKLQNDTVEKIENLLGTSLSDFNSMSATKRDELIMKLKQD